MSAPHHGPETLDLQQLTAELASAFDVAPASSAHLRALLAAFGTAAFRNQFSLAQVRAVLGVLQRVLEADMAAWQRGSAESLEYFQAELLALSVERPPHAEGLLNPVQATAALDFVLKAYYRACGVFWEGRWRGRARRPNGRGRPLARPSSHCCRLPAPAVPTPNPNPAPPHSLNLPAGRAL
jgi:hypothetical protein